jgi:hypothetical protein
LRQHTARPCPLSCQQARMPGARTAGLIPCGSR